jgi:hypothetical protein
MKFEGRKKYTEVAISRSHPLFSYGDGTSSISKHLGFQFLVKKPPSNPDWPKLPGIGLYENPEICNLMIGVEVRSTHWSFPEQQWDKGLGPTVLMTRKDMKDLTVHQVEALVCFSKTVLKEEMIGIKPKEAEPDADSDYENPDTLAHIPTQKVRKEFLEEYLLSDKFANFFEEFKQEKLAEGDTTWAGATVPRKGSVADEDILTEEEREELMRKAMGLLRIFFNSGMCET